MSPNPKKKGRIPVTPALRNEVNTLIQEKFGGARTFFTWLQEDAIKRGEPLLTGITEDSIDKLMRRGKTADPMHLDFILPILRTHDPLRELASKGLVSLTQPIEGITNQMRLRNLALEKGKPIDKRGLGPITIMAYARWMVEEDPHFILPEGFDEVYISNVLHKNQTTDIVRFQVLSGLLENFDADGFLKSQGLASLVKPVHGKTRRERLLHNMDLVNLKRDAFMTWARSREKQERPHGSFKNHILGNMMVSDTTAYRSYLTYVLRGLRTYRDFQRRSSPETETAIVDKTTIVSLSEVMEGGRTRLQQLKDLMAAKDMSRESFISRAHMQVPLTGKPVPSWLEEDLTGWLTGTKKEALLSRLSYVMRELEEYNPGYAVSPKLSAGRMKSSKKPGPSGSTPAATEASGSEPAGSGLSPGNRSEKKAAGLASTAAPGGSPADVIVDPPPPPPPPATPLAASFVASGRKPIVGSLAFAMVSVPTKSARLTPVAGAQSADAVAGQMDQGNQTTMAIAPYLDIKS